jgi:hypothetical protein
MVGTNRRAVLIFRRSSAFAEGESAIDTPSLQKKSATISGRAAEAEEIQYFSIVVFQARENR